jgi:ABC-type nitrate/sulfonate/bicarbonate transport system ATPase subunit
MVRLLTSGNAYIHQVFSEMKQRVAIAQALTITQRILLINKRFAALDIWIRQETFQQQLFQACQTIKKIVHFAKNDLIQEAVASGDRILIITIIIILSPKYEGVTKGCTIKLRHLRQLNNRIIVHAITEQITSHRSRGLEDYKIQDIKRGRK